MAYVQGTADDDLLRGTSDPDLIEGLRGNDTLLGAGGDDTLIGGSGNDVLAGEEGDNLLDGGAGDDDLDAGDGGDETLNGGSGNDRVTLRFAGAGEEGVRFTFSTGDGPVGTGLGRKALIGVERADITATGYADVIVGGPNDDVIVGVAGDDRLYGGAGDDQIIGGDNGVVLIDGGAGEDYISDNSEAVRDDTLLGSDGNDSIASFFGDDLIDGGDGIDTVTFDFFNHLSSVDFSLSEPDQVFELQGTTKTLISIEAGFIGGSDRFGDKFTGGAQADVLYGFGGDDALTGAGGDDELYGGAGDDVVSGGGGNDALFGAEGADKFLMLRSDASGGDSIIGFDRSDVILTDQALFDSNRDGIVTYGRDRKFNLSDSRSFTVADTDGRTVSAIRFEGSVFLDGAEYFQYSMM